MISAYWFALGASLAFSTSTVVFAHYARKVSAYWMNAFKAFVALVGFSVAFALTKDMSHAPLLKCVLIFMLSGLLGLNIGDLFLVESFRVIGAARTLVIFSFEPVILGIFAFFIFGQPMTLAKFAGIFFMIGCVFTLSYERFKKESRWDIRGPLFVLCGVALDAAGLLLTRYAFDSDHTITVVEGNFYRCVGANLGFLVMSWFKPIHLRKSFFNLKTKSRLVVLSGATLGTFVSLSLWLAAISRGHLASISAIGMCSPVFAATLECIAGRQKPTKYLIMAFALFAVGFFFIID